MATIVDRCQRFDFQRPSLEQIAEVVRRVAKAEAIEADDGAVALISRSASGSFRDALGTLDQLVAFKGPKVATDDVVEMLGAADADLLFDATDALASADPAAALEVVERLAKSGRDPGQFARDLTAHLRQLLVARATGEVPESFTVTVSQPKRLAEQAESTDDAKLMGAIDSLSTAVANMREGDDPRLTLEVALLKVAAPSLDSSREALLRRIESLESAIGGASGPVAADDSPEAATEVAPVRPPSAATIRELPDESPPASAPDESPDGGSSEPKAAKRGPEKVQSAAGAVVAAIDIERVTQLWPAVVDHVRESGAEVLSSFVEGARPLAVDTERSTLRVGFPASARFNKRKAEAQANVERIAESVKAVVGERLRPVYELMDGEAEPAEPAAAVMAEDEIIELLKTKFDASEVVDETPSEETG
jgi:DNA polymerase-3 subunit gamma/tau